MGRFLLGVTCTMNIQINDNNIIFFLEGRIDSMNSHEVEDEIMKALQDSGGKEPLFDMAGLDYISSAGLRVLMKVRKTVGTEVVLREVKPEVYDILETTGFTELLTVKKKMREISVDGLEVIGTGFYGTVYRIDADTIIKVYESADAIPIIENEKKMAKIAFLNGVPTAISYDIVKVGNSFGSVFELLNAKTFNDLIIENPDNADSIIRQYVDLMKQLHENKVETDEIPYAKDQIEKSLEVMHDYLPEEIYAGLMKLISTLEYDNHLVHCDIQMKNVMMSDGEPMLIDMDTLSLGQPIFDMAGIFVTYYAFEEDDPDNGMMFLGISNEICNQIWEKTVRYYYDTDDEKELNKMRDKIRILGYIRFLNIIIESDLKDSELGKIRIKHAIEHLGELIKQVDSLN